MHADLKRIAALTVPCTCSVAQRFTSASVREYSCRSFSSVAPDAMVATLTDS